MTPLSPIDRNRGVRTVLWVVLALNIAVARVAAAVPGVLESHGVRTREQITDVVVHLEPASPGSGARQASSGPVD